MVGLLYKDFISVNRAAKLHLTWIIAIYMIVFTVLRIEFPGTRELQEFMVTNEDGTVVNLIDSFLIMMHACFIIFTMTIIGSRQIMNNDEKNNIRYYFDSMPIGKNTYVASKYVFIGISVYIAIALDYVMGSICTAFCKEGRLQDIAAMVTSMAFNLVFLMLLLAAIELPLYIGVGKEIAMRAMTAFWTILAVVVIGFLMFGDLTVVSSWDIKEFVDFIENHKGGVLIFQSLEPAIILGLYFVSYLISCRLYHRKER